MSDVLTSYFHDGNMTPPPSPEAQTNLWGVGTRDSSDSEKEPFVRTRKLKRTWDEYCQSPKGYEKMKQGLEADKPSKRIRMKQVGKLKSRIKYIRVKKKRKVCGYTACFEGKVVFI